MSIPIPITSLLGLAYIIAACFLYISLSSILSSRQNTAKARQLKCQDPPELKSRYPIGTDLLLRLRSADKAKLFPVDLIQRFVDVGDTTYKYTLPGGHYHHVSTMDSKNILANLATQLKDFDLGSTRRRKFLVSTTGFLILPSPAPHPIPSVTFHVVSSNSYKFPKLETNDSSTPK